jgi:hypothetical protein
MRIEMRGSFKVMITALLACLIISGIALILLRPTPKGVVRKALTETVGANAVDCGWSAIGNDRSKQRECVFDNFQKQKPFIVLYEVPGKEEVSEIGLAGDSDGDVYILMIEAGNSFHRLYRTFIKDGKHLRPNACPKPPKLQVFGDNYNGYIVCASK